MTTPTDTIATPPSRKPSVEHIVLGVVLLAVLLGAGGWFLLKPGSSSSAAKPLPASTFVRPTPTMTAAVAAVVPAVVKPAVKPLTKVAYIKAGNKICAKMNAATKVLGVYPKATAAEIVFLNKTFAITEKARKSLQGLPAPKASAAKLKADYVDVAKLDAMGKSVAVALSEGKTTLAQQLLVKLAAFGTKTNNEFDAYGLTTCGS